MTWFLRKATPSAPEHTPRTARRRIAVAVAALATWVAGSALGTHGTPHAQALPSFAIGKAHPAEAFPALNGKKPIFVLALGSDARPGEPIDHERSDSIHIVGLNPAKGQASILGFPRDSWVDIPGHGSEKITSAMSSGGPQLTIQTVENLTGIHIDFYVLTSFAGLKSMIDAIDGVTVNVLQPMHDRHKCCGRYSANNRRSASGMFRQFMKPTFVQPAVGERRSGSGYDGLSMYTCRESAQ